MLLQWEEIDAGATVPDVQYRATGDTHDYRIFYDPDRKWFTYPDDFTGEWWIVIIREFGEDGIARITAGSTMRRTLAEVQKAAQDWEG